MLIIDTNKIIRNIIERWMWGYWEIVRELTLVIIKKLGRWKCLKL